MTTPRRSLTALAACTGAAVLLSACGSSAEEDTAGASPADTVTVANALPTLTLVEEDGESSLQEDLDTERGSVEVPLAPEAVVTFDIATLDTLDSIGAGDSVVGIPDVTLPDYLAEYASLPTVGTLFEPDFEAVAELDPDLIVTAGRSTGQYDELAEIATTIDLTGGYGGTFDPEAAMARAEQLGEVFGREDEVAEQVADLEGQVEEIADSVSGTALVLSVSGGEYSAFGEGSRFGWFYDTLGFTPAVVAAQLPGEPGSPHGESVSNEFILSAAPEWIIAFDRGAATGDSATLEATLDNELVGQTVAAEQDQVVYLPASELYILTNGLTAIGNVLDVVQDAVQA